MSVLELEVIGPTRVRRAGVSTPIRAARLRQLLAALLVDGPRTVRAGVLIDRLWAAGEDDRSAAALHVSIGRLRQLLEPDRVAPRPWTTIVHDGDGYRLSVDPDVVDRYRYERLVGEASAIVETNPEAALRQLADARNLWRGEPWEGLSGLPWLTTEISRVRDLCAEAIDVEAWALVATSQWERAITLLHGAIAEDPFRERRWELLMLALWGSGHQQRALAAYDDLRKMLVEELGVEPQPAIQRLRMAILDHDESALPRQRAHVPGGLRVPHNVPHPATRLIGRDDARADVAAALERARLVTLTGTGGTGKTRLAIDVALSLLGAFPDGVWFVDLDRVGNRAVAAELAGTLPVHSGDEPDLDGLVEFLRDRRALIVLDNCEQRVDDAAATVSRLLEGCAELRVLATSRVPLELHGEARIAVPPLELPDDGADASPSGGGDGEDTPLAPAAELFIERAMDHTPLDADDPEVRRHVHEIVHRLDGLPLAIELAAAELRVLQLDELAVRLQDRVAVLAIEQRERPERQRALRASLDISHNALDPADAMWVRRLSVLPAGFTLGLLAEGGFGPEAAGDEHLRLVDRLVASSLVAPSGSSPRVFRMLETTRQDALDRLREAGEEADARRWANEVLTHLAQVAREELHGPGQRAAVALLDALYPNVIEVLTHAEATGDLASVRPLAAALDRYWYVRPHWGDALRWLEVLMPPELADDEPLTHARLVLAAALTQRNRDDTMSQIRAHLERGLQVFVEHGELEHELEAAGMLALDAAIRGDLDRFDELLDRHAPRASLAEAPWYRLSAEALGAIGRAARGEVAEGVADIQRHRDAVIELGDVAFASRLSIWAAIGMRLLGDTEGARSELRRCLALSAQAGVGGMESRAMFMLADLGGDPGEREAVLEASLESAVFRGDRTLAGECARELAHLASERGDLKQATSLFRSAVPPLAELSPVDLGILLVHLVPLADPSLRQPLLDGAAEVLSHSTNFDLPARRRLVELLAAHEIAVEVDPTGLPHGEAPDTGELAALALKVLDAI